jgi:hypothetical protein
MCWPSKQGDSIFIFKTSFAIYLLAFGHTEIPRPPTNLSADSERADKFVGSILSKKD